MASLLIFLAFLFIVSRFAGSCLRLTDRSLPRGHRERQALRRGKAGCCGVQQSADPEVQLRPETPLEALQRRFADGQISLDHYEREVGRIYGLKSVAQDLPQA